MLMDLMIGRALRIRATGDYVNIEELKKDLMYTVKISKRVLSFFSKLKCTMNMKVL